MLTFKLVVSGSNGVKPAYNMIQAYIQTASRLISRDYVKKLPISTHPQTQTIEAKRP